MNNNQNNSEERKKRHCYVLNYWSERAREDVKRHNYNVLQKYFELRTAVVLHLAFYLDWKF